MSVARSPLTNGGNPAVVGQTVGRMFVGRVS